jgi:hypothetical protein
MSTAQIFQRYLALNLLSGMLKVSLTLPQLRICAEIFPVKFSPVGLTSGTGVADVSAQIATFRAKDN